MAQLKKWLSQFVLKFRGKMHIYYRVNKNHTVYVQPGKEHDSSEWKNADGSAILFTVKFKNGKAEVPDNLGRFMVDKGMAKSTMLILPSEKLHAQRIPAIKRLR